MKTPREWLLEKHRHAEPALNSIRQAVVSDVKRTPSASVEAKEPLAATLWRELFWSCRRVWFGLAGAWAAILLLNLAASSEAPPGARAARRDAPRFAETFQERQRLQEELLGITRVAAEAVPSEAVRPRSDRALAVRMC